MKGELLAFHMERGLPLVSNTGIGAYGSVALSGTSNTPFNPAAQKLLIEFIGSRRPVFFLADNDNASERFWTLADEWVSQTAGLSSMTARRRHPAYARIRALGTPAIPLLLRALEERPSYWFPLLREISHENPVSDSDLGDYDKMANAWLAWGRERGIVR